MVGSFCVQIFEVIVAFLCSIKRKKCLLVKIEVV